MAAMIRDVARRDLRPGRFQFHAQELRAGRVAPELVALEKVDPTAAGIVPAQEGGLARLARSQEEGLAPRPWENEVAIEHETQFIMMK